MKKLNYPALAAFTLVLLVFSYLQTNVFLLINGVIGNTAAYKANIEIPAFLYELNYSTLMAIKYATGFLYVLLSYYLLLRLSISCKLSKNYRLFIRFIYVLLISFVLFLHVLSFICGHSFQEFSLYFFKILISPIFPLVLFVMGYIPLFNETLPHNKRM